MNRAEQIFTAYLQLPPEFRSCGRVQKSLEEQGIQVSRICIRALLGTAAAVDIGLDDLVTTATVLRRLSEIALPFDPSPTDFAINLEVAEQITAPLAGVRPHGPEDDAAVRELCQALALLLECADQLRYVRQYMDYLDLRDVLRHRATADQSEIAPPAESGWPVDPPDD